MRLFKKTQPKLKITLQNGARLEFENIDNVVGIFGTEDPGLLAQIDLMISQGRGGIDEIGYPEWQALKEKKKNGSASSAPWREEMVNEAMKQRHPFEIPVAMESDARAAVPVAISAVAGEPPVVPVPVRPTATKRA